jgi:Kef-type K+ transport system membrane component KefB/nucleotide-binding universal stress UspA family protein
MLKINRASATYLIMAVIFIAGLWLILGFGATIRLPAAQAGGTIPHAAGDAHGASNPILLLLLQILLILALSRVVGVIFRYFHQPQVMGEMLAGIMLGPSVFGWIAPNAWRDVFPPASIDALNVLSQVGVIFFLFLIGLELDPKLLRRRGHAAVVISHVSILAPFLLGAALALLLYRNLYGQAAHMPFQSVALFMGAAMSVTAFPVLARILTERNLHKTKVGAVAITCAAVDDVTAWCMLAFVVAIARANGVYPAAITAVLSAIYIAVMFLLVRPFLYRLQIVHDRQGRLTQGVVAIIFLLVLASAYTTESIGIHALFGAFLMGAIMPKGTSFIRALSEKLEDYTVILLLPMFFAYTGLKTQIGLLSSPELWLYTLLVVVVACVGKIGGSMFAARAVGLPWREASAIGILMNTRGLMELVILNIGLKEGVITDAVFAMMVIMALVTTALTTPLLHWIYPTRLFGPAAEAQTPRKDFSILVPVARPENGVGLARLASLLIGDPNRGARVFALHLQPARERDAYRTGIDEPDAGDPALAPLLDEAARLHLPTESIAFVTRDVSADIAKVAAGRGANLVLIGFHKPVIGATILGGTVHRVLNNCPSDVGIFVDRGLEQVERILVPFMGSSHDRLSMELAGRIARKSHAKITVLHVVQPNREKALDAQAAVDRVFADPAQPQPVAFRVVHDASPVDAVLREAALYDLVVIAVAEEWGLESHLFGWRPERIARECPVSLMIVRRNNARETSPQPATPQERLVQPA